MANTMEWAQGVKEQEEEHGGRSRRRRKRRRRRRMGGPGATSTGISLLEKLARSVKVKDRSQVSPSIGL